MRVIEQFTCSKTGDPRTNEDALWIGEHFSLVADGVTAKNGVRWNGMTAGQAAAKCVIEAVEKLTGEETAREAFTHIQQTIRSMGFTPDLDPQASVLIYNHKRRELWSVGDCPFILNGVYHRNEKKVDKILSAARKMAIETLLLSGHTEEELLRHDLAREMMLPFLKLQPRLIDSDSELSYSVVDGIHPIRHLIVIPVPADSVLILATDGYPDLKSTLASSEDALAHILLEDPLCWRLYPSTKGISAGNISFDDRTFLKILT